MNRPDDPLINRTDRLHAFTPQWAVPPGATIADCAEEQGLPYPSLGIFDPKTSKEPPWFLFSCPLQV